MRFHTIRKRTTASVLSSLTLAFLGTIVGCGPSQPTVATETTAGESVALPPAEWVVIRNSPVLALSPDGATIALTGGADRLLYLRPVGGAASTPVAGTEGAAAPFFSPDGEWIGYLAGGNLMKAPLAGGDPVAICPAPSATAATWADDDSIVFDQGSLMRVPAAGGDPQPLTEIQPGETGHAWPEVLPGATAVLFTAATAQGWNFGDVILQDIVSGERRTLVAGATSARYISTGHLTYVQGGVLMAAPFDLSTLTLTGPARPVVENVMESSTGTSHYSLSADGALLYAPGGILGGDRNLVLTDREGNDEYIDAPPRRYGYDRLSPDGETIAIQMDWPTIDLWLYRFSDQSLTQFTTEGAEYPWWTPDGSRILFFSDRAGVFNIFWQPADGSGPAEQLTRSEYPIDHSYSISPDAGTLAFSVNHPATGMDIWTQPIDDPSLARPYLATSDRECCPFISPAGDRIAYLSNASGRGELYVSPFPGPRRGVQVSADGAIEPLFSRDGRELFYWNAASTLMVMDVPADPSQRPGPARPLFPGTYLSAAASWRTRTDITPDGTRFLLIRRGPLEDETKELYLIADFPARLPH